MAEKYKVYLVMGVIEREGYTLYCTVLFFDSHGQYLGKHRKLMPTALERVIWGFGDGSTIPVYETPIGKIGALICWENRMPLLRTAMYGKGEYFDFQSYYYITFCVLFQLVKNFMILGLRIYSRFEMLSVSLGRLGLRGSCKSPISIVVSKLS